MSYEVGSKARSTVTVTDVDGTPTDATMSIAVTKPDGTLATPPAIIDDLGSGLYHADITLTMPGVWTIVWVASGAVIAVYTNQLTVREPGPRIVSLDDAKRHLNKDLTVHTDDDELRAFIDAAQIIIEGQIGPVVPVQKTELYAGWVPVIVLRRRPVFTLTLVREFYGGVYTTVIPEAGFGTAYDYQLDSGPGLLYRRSGLFPTTWMGDVEVTYSAGRNPIPGNIRLAALEELGHLWRNSQLARGSARAAAGAEDVLSSLAFSLPHRVQELLAKNRRAPMQGS